MIQLTKEQIREVADEFDAGFKCFYHIESKEIKSIFDESSYEDDIDELLQEEIDEVERNIDKYIEIKAPDTDYSFEIMASFAETVDNELFHERLINALNRTKPFRNFKYEIDNSGDYRQKWFSFKRMMLEEWVKEEIDFINRNEN